MAHIFQALTTNLVGMVRNETLEGRDYLVVPMVMIVEGVLNGSNGALYYPAEELAKIPQVWNHKPVVIRHPEMNGQPMSACDPAMIEKYKVGIILNASFDGKRLVAEAWLEPSRLELIDNRVLDALNSGMMMEVSTGLFVEHEKTPGEFGGKGYDAIARNFRPDHLAILPDQIGACSIEDGAGLLRVNTQSRAELDLVLNRMSVNEMSQDDIRGALYAASTPLKSGKDMDFWIEDIFDDWFVYSLDGKLFKQGYSISDNEAVLDGLPVEVLRKTVYSENSIGDNTMNKEQFVNQLIANGKWTEDDRKFLMAMSEDRLTRLAPETNTEPEPKAEPAQNAEPEPKPPKKKPEPKAEPAQNVSPAQMSAADYLANAPAEIRDVIQDSLQTNAEVRANLIAEITANERNVFTAEQLASMPTGQLKAVAALAKNTVQPEPKPQPFYFGQAPVALNTEVKPEPLEIPIMNFAKEGAASN